MTKPLNLYPISEKAPDAAVSASGMPLDSLTLDAVVSGQIGPADIRISADVLRMQAGISRAAGRERLALNLERAAELVVGPAGRHPGDLRDAATRPAIGPHSFI